ncbi:TldD family protein [Clostridium botulinum]|uniref:TldD family protein n=4 Tax=Clostridium botulinum TaxID=1491 RepID=A0A077K8P5_CLOBO|nr:metallopeptidase TldD-related protein [Clostridium botulinum]NFB54488.1 TldD family protein [Clostridium botulinum]NFC89541.1 TldD family protein [Clostridium botulinum]NFD07200.1 TldD family protein [Clostridium botulinum]NFF14033.1 TldD family protein [Clostridium botulinum]BAP28088.1 TldD family protein [Clostridium botulinum]
MNYKQSVYTIQLRYLKDDFEYIVNSFSGEREENIKNTKLNTCKSLFYDLHDVPLNISTHYLKKLEKYLRCIKKDIKKKGSDITFIMHLHNEKVLIDNRKEDNRSYGFLRLHFRDNDNNMHIDDIPILSSDPDDLEDRISYYSKKNASIRNLDNKEEDINFGFMPHILSPNASGYFIHEIVGHTLEGDNYSYYKNKYENMNISKKLTVIDSINGYDKLIGLQSYDDVGTKIKPLTLINKGKVQNILATQMEDSFDHNLYGVARRESYKFDVFPRMRGTYIQPFDDMDQQNILDKYKNAIFVNETFQGSVSPKTGDYSLMGNGFVVKNGELENFIGDLRINGNVLKDLSSIEYIGKDFDMFGRYCGKLGQNVRVGIGSPTISISSLNSRGRLYGKR